MLEDLGFQLPGRPKYGITGYIGLARGISTGIKRCHVRILGRNHMHIRIGNPNGFGRHLCHNRIQTLADFGGAHLNVQGGILVENNARTGNFHAGRISPGGIAKTGHTQSATQRAGLFLRPGCPLFIPANQLLTLLDTFDQTAAFKALTAERIGIALAGHIFDSERYRVHADFTRCLFNDALNCEYHLGGPVSPHGTGGRSVRINGPGVIMHGRPGIKRARFCAGGTGHRMPVRSVGTGIGHSVHIQRHQGPVFIDPGTHLNVKWVTGPGSDHTFFPGQIDFDRTPAQLQS